MNVKVCPKMPRSQQFSGFSSEMGVANSVVMTCPETLTYQLKRQQRRKMFWLRGAHYYS